ncbi:MAG: OmpA family protein [Pseudomonadota bacterium]
MRALTIATCCLGLGATPLPGVTLDLPAAAQPTVERITAPDSYFAPTGAFDGASVPALMLEGTVARRAWRIGTEGLTTLQVMQPLRAQLEALGFDIVFECTAQACGGFDFRFAIEVLPGPNMYVNIARYRFLTALRSEADRPEEAVTVLVSATAASAYIQLIQVDPGASQAVFAPNKDSRDERAPGASQAPGARQENDGNAESVSDTQRLLERQGHLVLTGLDFELGSTDLGSGPFGSLAELAEALDARPDWRVALVGHTDAIGSLSSNISLSRARANAVRTRLIERYGVSPERLDAEGAGYLAPNASNLSPQGRAENRRVDAVLLNTE